MVLSAICIRTYFSRIPVLISSKNCLGKFSSVKITFCVFFRQKYFFEKKRNFKYDMLSTSNQIRLTKNEDNQ